MTSISAIIITRNEVDRIAETVRSLKAFCDEVLVVDSESTDATAEVARLSGARVLVRPWTGYSEQKNFAAGEATNDWVLSIDADERPGLALANEIADWKVCDLDGERAAWSMPRLVSYMGRWVRHSGWYPDRKVRLYDRRRAVWEGAYVHESLRVDGSIGRFVGDLLHFPYRSVADHHRRIDRYTALAAESARSRGRRFNPLMLVFGPPGYFLKSYLLRAGFLDRGAGLRIAYMGARYVFLREFRILR